MIVGLLTLISCAGDRPTTLGVQNNQLSTCPDSPNCVSSFDQRDSHGIAPLTGDMDAVRAALAELPQAAIVTDDGNYIHAEFTSRLMGFVDDVEFLADPASDQVHVRSASRLGHSDLGVNRERVENIRELMGS
ncbi:hypothetical protein PHACT_09750 [Pseudohongiella acticola]|uniref:DUF1499 domain-containing protein n=2 Tax=Pseudohongiella acticola TaxID=1524254 RepID=A0A1E8CP61_9GAMM|nr:hypothetical protein PHACT_09750 [Pseudohongiella acticola]